MSRLKAPFPYFGGNSRFAAAWLLLVVAPGVAHTVRRWRR